MDSLPVLAFLTAAIPTFFSPGPNNLMLMASGAKFGLKRTIPHLLGIVVGFPLMVFVVGLGLGEVFAQFPQIKQVMRWLAAAYFAWMAFTLLGLKIGNVRARERPMRFIEAALFQWINPKAWAMAISFVTLVVTSAKASRLLLLSALTLGCLALGPFSGSLWMVFGQQLERFLRRTGLEQYLGLILAGLMMLAVVLFLL